MREILFRGKAINRNANREYRTDYKNDDWVYGLVYKLYNDNFPKLPAEMTNENGVTGIDVDYTTICQYSGLTDKNGNKIFEGDIVRYLFGNNFTHLEKIGVVKYTDGAFSIISDRENKDFEVIGNTYDNPELLKGVSENENK